MLKAHAATCDLQRISYLRTDTDNARALRALRAPLERIELDPQMHRLRVLDVMQAVSAGECRLPDELMTDLELLCASDDPLRQLGVLHIADAREAAVSGAGRWARFGQDPRRAPIEARPARIVKQAYELLLAETATTGDPP